MAAGGVLDVEVRYLDADGDLVVTSHRLSPGGAVHLKDEHLTD